MVIMITWLRLGNVFKRFHGQKKLKLSAGNEKPTEAFELLPLLAMDKRHNSYGCLRTLSLECKHNMSVVCMFGVLAGTSDAVIFLGRTVFKFGKEHRGASLKLQGPESLRNSLKGHQNFIY